MHRIKVILIDDNKRVNDIIASYFNEENKIVLVHNDLNLYVTRLLHQLGIPSHIKGYKYINESIMIIFKRPEMKDGIMKGLYLELALKYLSSVSSVEKAIRHAIEISWYRGSIEIVEDIFGYSVHSCKTKPTNLEYIVTIVDKIRLELSKTVK